MIFIPIVPRNFNRLHKHRCKPHQLEKQQITQEQSQTTAVGRTGTETSHNSWKKRLNTCVKNTFNKGKTKVAPPEYSDATTAHAEHPKQGKQKKISFKIAL